MANLINFMSFIVSCCSLEGPSRQVHCSAVADVEADTDADADAMELN